MSPSVMVLVTHHMPSFELSVQVGLSSGTTEDLSRERFTVWEIARLAGTPDVSEATFLQATTQEEVAHALSKLADTLAQYGRRALHGDQEFFSALRVQQEAESTSFLKKGRAAYIRKTALQAWDARDFARVVELLSEMPVPLSIAETKKLEFARKQLKSE
jgi:hypothetical protein